VTRSRVFQALRVGAGALLVFLLVTVLWAPVTEVLRPSPRWTVVPVPLARADGVYHVYVSDLGYHTSITVEQPAGWHLGPPGAEDAPYLEWGWGDRGFYQFSDFSPRGVYSALFLPTPSVVYLSGERDAPDPRSLKHVWGRTVDGETLRLPAKECGMPFQFHTGLLTVAPLF
jgi:hypothetical protein